MKLKLTATTIAGLTLPDGKREDIFFDESLACFGVRMRSSGHKSFVVQYARGGKTKRVPLGSVTEIELSKARNTAKTILAQVRLGQDPALAKVQARARAGETFGAKLQAFLLHQQAKLKPRSMKETERHLLRMCKPLHPLPIAGIDRRAIAARLTEIAELNGPAAANRVRGSLSAYFTWLIGQGLAETSPVAFTNRAIENGPRKRKLTDLELTQIWRASLDAGQYGVILRLLLLTGLRRSEVAELSWSEIDLEAGLIRIPGERTKNSKPHYVPLSAPVCTLLEAQPQRDGLNKVFAEPLWNRCKIELDARIADLNGAPPAGWVLHDFRRVFSTRLHEEFGIAPHLVEVLLGHVGHQAGVAGVYNQATYLPECRNALDRWADYVLAIVTGETAPAKIVPLRRSA
jgi:integrase